MPPRICERFGRNQRQAWLGCDAYRALFPKGCFHVRLVSGACGPEYAVLCE
jgi:hypothetical protein